MPKPIVQIRNASIVCTATGAQVLSGDLASKHPVLGEPVPAAEGANRIVTSRIVEQRLSKREVETLNTVYQLVD